MRKIWLVIWLILATASLIKPAHAGARTSVDIVILSCDFNDSPRVTIRLGPNARGQEPPERRLPVRQVSSSVYEARGNVDAGVYTIFSSNKNCGFSSPRVIGVPAGASRHIVDFMRLSNIASLATLAWSTLSVDLPAQDISIALVVLPSRRVITPVWDRTTAYFDNVLPGKYLLVLSDLGARACLPFEVADGIERRLFHKAFDMAQIASLLRRDPSSGALKCPEPRNYGARYDF